ncbi:MAG: nucleoside hydrolase [Candidatus Acidiferrales bacterium]
MKRIIIDTDTASDDAVALLLALRDPSVQLDAITIVAGNVDFDQQTENALYTIEMAGRSGEVPVYCGARQPISRNTHQTVTNVHGKDGMGDSFFPRARQRPEPGNAVDAITSIVHKYPGEVTLFAIGPFTNVALALQNPAVREELAGIYFMGGSYLFCGNITPAATYNPWVDPEAARAMILCGVPLWMTGFDVTWRNSIFTDADYDDVAKLGTPLARFFCEINRTRRTFCKEKQRLRGSNHPDALTLATFLDSSVVVSSVQRYADVEIAGELTSGMIVIDELGVWGKKPNLNICVSADEAKFKRMVLKTLR